MALQWIKVTKELPEKPEVWMIAEYLGIEPDAVVGKLIRVFSWFDDHSEDGSAPTSAIPLLNRIASNAKFVEAMKISGWIFENEEEISGKFFKNSQKIFLKNFERHNGGTAKSRALTASRQEKMRNAKVTPNASPEKRREEKRRKKEYSENFLEFWDLFSSDFGAKGSKAEAWAEFQKLKPDAALLTEMKSAVIAQKSWKARQRENGEFSENFKHVCRWLKGQRWEDEVPAVLSHPREDIL
jgi:hypothetical protein